MKKPFIVAVAVCAGYLSFGQTRPRVQATPPLADSGYVVIPARLKISETGFPVYYSVLRYNDSIVLGVDPIGKTYSTIPNGSHAWKSDWHFELRFHTVHFSFPSTILKPEQVLELVSKYRFRLEDNVLYKDLTNDTNKQARVTLEGGTNDLPDYLKLSLEMIRLK